MNIVLLSVLIVLNLVLIGLCCYLAHLFRQVIVPVFRSDTDATLAAVLDSLDTAAKLAARVAKDLDVNIAEARQQFSRLVVLLDHLQDGVNAGTEAAERMAEEDRLVAERLVESQRTARGLDPDSPPGSAADSAASGPDE